MSCPFHPMRPINGGHPSRAFIKEDEYFQEPKYNGWRCLLNTSTGILFDRHRRKICICKEMLPAIKLAQHAFSGVTEWLDCEGLERRHNLGLGSLIVLDPMTQGVYEERRQLLTSKAAVLAIGQVPSPQSLYAVASYQTSVASFCGQLQEFNRQFGTELLKAPWLRRWAMSTGLSESPRKTPTGSSTGS